MTEKQSKVKKVLILVVFIQFLVLIGMYINSVIPLYFGSQIKVKTLPVDPRSLFRGHYVRLPYEFSRIKSESINDLGDKDLRNGDYLYISLKQDKDGLHTMSQVNINKPSKGIFIRGRIQNKYYRKNRDEYRVKYNIEAFFAPKDKALEIEKKLRRGGIAVLMVMKNGKVALKAIESNKS